MIPPHLQEAWDEVEKLIADHPEYEDMLIAGFEKAYREGRAAVEAEDEMESDSDAGQ